MQQNSALIRLNEATSLHEFGLCGAAELEKAKREHELLTNKIINVKAELESA